MAVNKRLLQGAAGAAGGLVPSEHFGVALYEGDGSSSHSINGGKFGAGAYFNGSSSQITTSNNIPLEGEFAISLWLRQDAADHSGNGALFDFGYNSSPYMFAWIDNGTIRFDDNTAPTGRYSYSTATTSNVWNHIVITRNSSNTTSFYLNGSLDGTSSNFTQDVSHPFTIGYSPIRNGGASDRLGGKVDQVRIFSKGLSSSEVSTLYAETASTVESLDPLSEDTTDTLQVLGDSSCIATYRFENDETDLSGNYNITGSKVQYAAGRYGQGVSMNGGQSAGTSSLLEITNSITTPSELSLSIWFRKNATLNAQNIFNFDRNVGGTGLQLYINSGNVFVFRISTSGTNHFSYTGSTGIYNGWNHVVITWQNQASGQAKLYLNNNLETTQTSNQTGAISFPGNNQFVGSESGGASGFSGELDQLRIFNKEVSAAEVTTLYQENSLVASYRFEGNALDDMRAYDGTASNVTYEYGLGFTPDFIWYKTRTQAYDHNLSDSTRGAAKQVRPNRDIAEVSATDQILSFDTGGFTVGSGGDANKDGDDYVAWCLKANGGTTSSNTDGTVTSTVQANTDAGFSIIKYTGNGVINQSIGHGLDSTPELYITKNLDTGGTGWFTKTTVIDGSLDELALNTTDAASNVSNTNLPTSSVIYQYNNTNLGANGQNYIVYAFHSVDSFSKFGSYTGNGSTNGPIVETGFEPAFLMIKQTDDVANWCIVDNKRSTTNPRNKTLRANSDVSEATVGSTQLVVDFLSNGFQLKQTSGNNVNNGTFLYMAFAADPDTEAPTVAKSFSTVSYTGTGSTQTVDGLGFSPSLTWIKGRTNTASHQIFDTIRGATFQISSDTSTAETQNTSMLTSFDSDGVTLGGQSSVNGSGVNYVAWNWKADDNEPTINTEGSIDSVVSANANAGFSIVKWDGTGAINTVGHGLSAAPELIIFKSLDITADWQVYAEPIGNGNKLILNSSAAQSSTTRFDSTSPTSTVFTLRDVGLGTGQIAYCFHSVSGYSKIGSYSGTGSAGNAQNVGFTPDWLMVKRYVGAASQWIIIDSVRGTKALYADLSNAESSESRIFLNSTGFEFTGSAFNESSTEWIYMAFKIN